MIDFNKLVGEQPHNEGDFLENGLMMCGKCRTPKQMRVEMFGGEQIIGCMCDCRTAEYEEEKRIETERKRRARIEFVKRVGIRNPAYMRQTFAADDGKTDLTFARAYVDGWEKYGADNVGLMLYGDTGRGKTFAACCIVNELIERSVSAVIWQFGDLMAQVSDMFDPERDEIFWRIENADILMLDDFGVQRGSGFALEQAERIIDARYRARKPLIITTNLDIADLKGAQDIRVRRTYERVIEMCYPKQIQGVNRRSKMANDRFAELRGVL